jgi:hypothetical protein
MLSELSACSKNFEVKIMESFGKIVPVLVSFSKTKSLFCSFKRNILNNFLLFWCKIFSFGKRFSVDNIFRKKKMVLFWCLFPNMKTWLLSGIYFSHVSWDLVMLPLH